MGKPSKSIRWHKAVASHSSYGQRNPHSLSSIIENEDGMNHIERKSFRLPCGRTLAESWAALRKAWLGFKIALSNGDRERMSYYASFIVKVQTEMGIEVTDFDTDIIDEDSLLSITESCYYKKPVNEPGATVEEKVPDYDSMMDEARGRTDAEYNSVSTPRQNIFDNSKNSCMYQLPERPDVVTRESSKLGN